MEQDEIDEFYGLPETWARHTQTRTKQDSCNVCEAPFSMVAAFGMGQRDFYCKQCGFAVCKDCSKNKKRLSIKDEEKFRVCDFCDTKLENARLKVNFEKLIALKAEKVTTTQKLLERLREQKQKLQKEIADEALAHRKKMDILQQKIDKEKQNTHKLQD